MGREEPGKAGGRASGQARCRQAKGREAFQEGAGTETTPGSIEDKREQAEQRAGQWSGEMRGDPFQQVGSAGTIPQQERGGFKGELVKGEGVCTSPLPQERSGRRWGAGESKGDGRR